MVYFLEKMVYYHIYKQWKGTAVKLPANIQQAVNEVYQQTGLMYMTLGDISEAFDDDERDVAEIKFINSYPEDTLVFPEL